MKAIPLGHSYEAPIKIDKSIASYGRIGLTLR